MARDLKQSKLKYTETTAAKGTQNKQKSAATTEPNSTNGKPSHRFLQKENIKQGYGKFTKGHKGSASTWKQFKN